MNIPPLNPENSLPIPKTRTKGARVESQRNDVAQDSVKTEPNDSLMNALQNDPEVRAGMVDFGKSLVADPNYPPKDVIANLAELFVKGHTK